MKADEFQGFILSQPMCCKLSTIREEWRNVLWIKNDDAPVIADFAAVGDVRGDCVPSKSCFKNLSKNANSYLWDFGDGTTSTEKHSVSYVLLCQKIPCCYPESLAEMLPG